ncbi:hypothetical protein [Sciscionella sediminilitoris]|uniref:hypothetical protein n=1 Tax=Sciscionella sediminilitoris TaxID=1445613 RepID=UPI0004DF14CA|nr:hypothetical protein [Sciscionella sp. SE31]
MSETENVPASEDWQIRMLLTQIAREVHVIKIIAVSALIVAPLGALFCMLILLTWQPISGYAQ